MVLRAHQTITAAPIGQRRRVSASWIGRILKAAADLAHLRGYRCWIWSGFDGRSGAKLGERVSQFGNGPTSRVKISRGGQYPEGKRKKEESATQGLCFRSNVNALLSDEVPTGAWLTDTKIRPVNGNEGLDWLGSDLPAGKGVKGEKRSAEVEIWGRLESRNIS